MLSKLFVLFFDFVIIALLRFAADVPGLPVLPGVARSDSLHQLACLHVLQRLVHV